MKLKQICINTLIEIWNICGYVLELNYKRTVQNTTLIACSSNQILFTFICVSCLLKHLRH